MKKTLSILLLITLVVGHVVLLYARPSIVSAAEANKRSGNYLAAYHDTAKLGTDGSNYFTGSSTVSSVAGLQSMLPRAGVAGALAATLVTESSNGLDPAKSLHLTGPDQYADICNLGALCGAASSSTTANTTSGLRTVKVAAASNFVNGQYVTIYHAGTPVSFRAPAFTVTPTLNAGGLNTVAADSGSTSFSYKIVAVDKFHGYSAASSPVSISTGNALGVQSINITSMARSRATVTVTTSAAHPFTVGTEVFIKYINSGGTNTDNTFNGFYRIATVPDTTHFTFLGGFDTAAPGATTSDIGGIAIGFTANTLAWTPVTGIWKYLICGRTSSAYNLIGQSLDNFWVDYGSPINDNQTFSAADASACSGAGANDNLTAKIVSGGGTTTLTLASSARADATGATIVSDDGPALKAACVAFGPVCYIPSTGAVINSYTIIPGVNLVLAGNVTLNDTIEFTGNEIVEGHSGASGDPFAWAGSDTAILTGHAYPMLTLDNGAHYFTRVSIDCVSANGCLDVTDYSTINPVVNVSFDYSTLSTGNGNTTDYLGMHAIFQGDGFSYAFYKDSLSTGSPGGNDEFHIGQSPIPTVVFKNTKGVGGMPTGNFRVSATWLVGRASFDQDYSFNTGGINWFIANDIQTQNGFIPPFMITGVGGLVGNFDLENISQADFPTATFANLGPGTQVGLYMRQISARQGSTPATTGAQTSAVLGPNVNGFGQNDNFTSVGGIFTNNIVSVSGAGAFVYPMAAPAPPATVQSSGGAVPTGRATYVITAVDVNGNQTSISAPSPTLIIISGKQTVKGTPPTLPLGAIGYIAYRSNNGGGYSQVEFASCGVIAPGVNFVDKLGYTCAVSPPAPAAATSSLSAHGMSTNQLNVAGGGYKDSLSGTFTANRTQLLPDVSGTVQVVTASTATLTPGTNVTSVTCLTATCTSLRGTLSIVGGTATTGTVATLSWPATPSAYVCTATQNPNGGTTSQLGVGNTLATPTGFSVSVATAITGLTLQISYSCQP